MIARCLLLGLVLLLGACSTRPPSNVGDACVIFEEKGGWFNNWERYARNAEREYGIPAPILLATIWKESAFRHNARPPRTRLLGFIPWRRPSNAYGYPQALNSTWKWYQDSTGRSGSRTSFKDSVRFVAWYHDQSHRRNGIARTDAYNLYLAYYAGHGGYARGTWRGNRHMTSAASRVAGMAQTYDRQLRACGRR